MPKKDFIIILKQIEPEEFYESIKREAVEVDGQWVARLTFRDGTVKHLTNLAVPVETLAGEKFEDADLSELKQEWKCMGCNKLYVNNTQQCDCPAGKYRPSSASEPEQKDA
jgi:rubrerythrin